MLTDLSELPGTAETGIAHPHAKTDEDRSGDSEDSIGRNSLRSRMRLVNVIFATGIVAFTAITHVALQIQVSATDELTRLNEAEQYAQDADRLHDNLRGDLYAALLAPRLNSTDAEGLARAWRAEVARFRDDLQNQAKLSLPPTVEKNVEITRQRAEEFLVRTENLIDLANHGQASMVTELPSFEAQFSDLGHTFEKLNSVLSEEISAAKRQALIARDKADRYILLAAASIILATIFLTWTITNSVRRSVRDVSAVARSLAAGGLNVRYEKSTSDEIGAIGASLNAMADSLQGILRKMRTDAENDRFNKQLVEALEVADSEDEIAEVVSRAMLSVSSTHPMELLLADPDLSRLQTAAQHPDEGGPGCGVQSTEKCLAIRRGNTLTFPDSEQLNTCPYLRDRPSGPVSATCVPLSFMGSSLGVLHATSRVTEPLNRQSLTALNALAAQAGARTGTVRAFRRTKILALTDSMTGLSNRRSLEASVRELIGSSSNFSVVMADLDHFKKLNDTHGHSAGDKALRLFADVVKDCMRGHDRAARWGGEEFVVVLVGTSAAQAMSWTARLSAKIAERCKNSDVAAFTASFGIADSSMSSSLEGLLQIADSALYVSKNEGRDRATIGNSDRAGTDIQ